MAKKKNFPQKILSPSSIATYLDCNRKYYNRYCLGIDDSFRFALIRGSMVHKVVEDFFYLKASDFQPDENDDYEMSFCVEMEKIFDRRWNEKQMRAVCDKEDMDYDTAKMESLESVLTFARIQWFNIRGGYRKMKNFARSWFFLKPKFSERKLKCESLHLRGVVDAIIDLNDELYIMDYKTSNIFKLPFSEEYKRQLTMYSLMMRETEGEHIYHVGNWFLKYGIQALYEITEDDIDKCKALVEDVYAKTRSIDVNDYPCNTDYMFCSQEWCSQCTPKCPIHDEYDGPDKVTKKSKKNDSKKKKSAFDRSDD